MHTRSMYIPDSVWERARSVFYYGTRQDPDLPQSFSGMIVEALELYCMMMERERNGGDPFPPAPEKLPKGPSLVGKERQSETMRRLWSEWRESGGRSAR